MLIYMRFGEKWGLSLYVNVNLHKVKFHMTVGQKRGRMFYNVRSGLLVRNYSICGNMPYSAE